MSRIECNVCMEDFSAHERIPKGLPCGHTFCNVCLENITSEGQLLCPTCKRQHTLPAGGVQDIATNHGLLDLLDRFCNSCKKLSDTKTCFHCPSQLCSGCLSDHVVSEVSEVTTEMVDNASDLLNSLDTKLKTIGVCLAQYRTLIDTSRDVLKQSGSDRAVGHIYEQVQICTDSMLKLKSAIQVQLGRVDLKIPGEATRSRKTRVTRDKTSRPQKGDTGARTRTETEQTPGGVHKIQSGAVKDAKGRMSRAARKSHTRMSDTYKAAPIRVFGSLGSAADHFEYPWGAARNMRGDVIITDWGNSRVCGYDSEYRPILSISVEDCVRDVCVTPSGDMGVACGDRLRLFSAAGQLVWEVGHQGKEQNRFNSASGVTCDSAGLIYVCDCGNRRLQVYNQSGKHVKIITGDGVSRMMSPRSVAVHPKTGRLYVVDQGHERVSIYTTGGRYEGCIAGIPGVSGVNIPYVSFRDDGLLALSDGNGRVYLLRGEQLVQTIGCPGSQPGQFNMPRGTVFTAGGDLVVCDSGNQRVQVFTVQA